MAEGRVLDDNPFLLKQVKETLAQAGVVSAGTEAEILIQHFGQMTRMELFSGEKKLPILQENRLREAVENRIQGVPLAYLLKEAEFFGHKFFVNENVLVPRPETEILVQEALRLISLPPLERRRTMAMRLPLQVLDIGTGCGCIAIALTLERPDIRMTALDVSKEALKIARKNMDFHELEKRIVLVESDLFTALGGKQFDIVVSNPPYIPEEDLADLPREVKKEPVLALDGGHGGFRVMDKILDRAPDFLRPGGFLILEIGKGQAEILAGRLARMAHYEDVRFVKDYNGINRVLIAKRR